MTISIGSEFNAEIICLECKDREEVHPLYDKACKAKAEAAKRGDIDNGIHLPRELRKK